MPHSKTERRAKVLIVDDHPPIREALAFRIGRQSDLEVCGEAAGVDDALRLVEATHPDIAIVDISLKTGSGFDLLKRIKELDGRVRTLVWSSHSESLYAERAIRAGALGFVNKDQETERIIEAIRRVLEGKLYLSEAMTEMMLRRAVSGARSVSEVTPLEMLANRELEVLRLIGQGLKTAEIAGRMNVGIKTVETYRERIREKLNLSNGAELAHYATKWMLENG